MSWLTVTTRTMRLPGLAFASTGGARQKAASRNGMPGENRCRIIYPPSVRTFPRLRPVQMFVQEPEGFHGVDLVNAVEPFYCRPVGDAQECVESPHLGV